MSVNLDFFNEIKLTCLGNANYLNSSNLGQNVHELLY